MILTDGLSAHAITESHSITAEEWLGVLLDRAQRIARKPIHQHSGKYYAWDWGMQPDGEALQALLADDPVDAAVKYISLYDVMNRARSFPDDQISNIATSTPPPVPSKVFDFL